MRVWRQGLESSGKSVQRGGRLGRPKRPDASNKGALTINLVKVSTRDKSIRAHKPGIDTSYEAVDSD
eukprot:681871-Pelagomonas_calceolata.AAC.2